MTAVSPSASSSSVAARRATLAALSLIAVTTAAGALYTPIRRALRRRRRKSALKALGASVEEDERRREGEEEGGVSWAEIATHKHVDSVWIVISGSVYDVTTWIDEHPGGRFALLAFAGRDATEAFDSIGHSAIARREFVRLLVGPLSLSLSRDASPSKPGTLLGGSTNGSRKVFLTGGKLPTRGDARSGDAGRRGASLWDITEHGFLPNSDPVGMSALSDTAWSAFADLADLLPTLTCSGTFREYLDRDEQLQARLQACGAQEAEQLTSEQLERAFAVVGYTMLAYLRCGSHFYGEGLGATTHDLPVICAAPATDPLLPAFIGGPMLVLSERIGRPPMVDYASSVLYNWERIDKEGPITMSNIKCLLRLTGLSDEEWFFKTHVIIESEAAHAVSAIAGAMLAKERADNQALLDHLGTLEEALWRVVRACLPIMYERNEDGTPRCSEFIFYHVLRPLIKSGTISFLLGGSDEPIQRQVNGPSGAMSSLMPCCDAALGIHMTSEKLQKALRSFQASMPVAHQSFLETLRSQGSLRSYIKLLRRPGGGDETADALVRAFNGCIARVLDFRWQHWSYVRNFINKPGNISNATGTGGTTFDFLQLHISDTANARISLPGAFHTSGGNSPHMPEWQSIPQPLVMMPPMEPHALWSVDGPQGLLAAEPMWGLQDFEGKWRQHLPPKLQPAVKVLLDLATKMPALSTPDVSRFYRRCEAVQAELAPLSEDAHALMRLPENVRERLMCVLSFVGSCCMSKDGSHREPPRCIKKPWQTVARSVGRPVRLELTELVLSNWCLAPATRQSPEATSQATQFDTVWRFLASPEEDWYRKLHIVLHQEARDVITAIRMGQAASRELNDRNVITSMERLAHWLHKFCDYFDAHFEQKDSRTEAVTARRLNTFVTTGIDEEQAGVWVYCSGSSVLLPALHDFLGVRLPDANLSAACGQLDRYFREWKAEMREYMPRLHRSFLEELEKPGVSMRQYCLKRFGAQAVSVDRLHDLEAAYNEGINALVRFLSRRMHLVSRFYPHLTGQFTALHSEIEAKMRQSRLQLLKMRQRVDRCFDVTASPK